MRRSIQFCTLLAALGGTAWALWLYRTPPEPCPSELVMPLLEAADLDGDGRVVQAEYAQLAPPELPFELYDQDGDGALDNRELGVLLLCADPLWLQRMPY